MASKAQKEVKKVYHPDTGSAPASRVVCKKNGDVEVKKGYFYCHGNTADKWAARVEADLKAAGVKFVNVYGRDDWAVWPKDSYFVAVVEV